MDILMSGIHGFIGSNLSRFLRGKQYTVAGTSEKGWKSMYDTAPTFDVRDKESILNEIKLNRPSVFVNLASRKGSDYCDRDVNDAFQCNVIGTKNVIECCNITQTPLIHFGTTAYYYSDESLEPISEKSTISPRTFYGWTKYGQVMMIEQMAKVPWMVIEPVFLYGNVFDYASNRSESVPDILIKLKNNLYDHEELPIVVRIDPRYKKDYTHIKDFCFMFERILSSPKWGQRITVGAGHPEALIDAGENILKEVGKKVIFDCIEDYKKNQVHDYSKLHSLYPDLYAYKSMSLNLREYFVKNGRV
jgi:nucleoside-diphosphate-sugar epimerase